MPQLQITAPGGRALEPVTLEDRVLEVGRGEEADLRLDDSSVSRQHAAIGRDRHQAWIQNHDSLNGVWVNGQRVENRAELKNRDRIMIGDFEVTFLT